MRALPRFLFSMLAVYFVLNLAFTPVLAGNEALKLLQRMNVKMQTGEGALAGDLVTIVPSSGRIVLNSTENGAVVLQLVDNFRVMEGRVKKNTEDLVRGEKIVLVVDMKTNNVKSIYKVR
jgi:hypothetical protein